MHASCFQGESFMQQGAAGVGGGSELSFEFVADAHQFVYLGHNAVLFRALFGGFPCDSNEF